MLNPSAEDLDQPDKEEGRSHQRHGLGADAEEGRRRKDSCRKGQ